MNDLASLTVSGRTATLQLMRPDARNALSLELLDALHARVGELHALEGVTVVVVTGAGRAFCAGMDLKTVTSDEGLAAGLPHRLLSSLARLTLRLRTVPMVTVAKVNGAAIGGGCGLACVCDLVVTHADAKVGFPEVDLGVCPAVVAPWLVRRIGAGRARRVLLSGGVLSGDEAHAVGIADVLAPSREGLDDACAGVVARLEGAGPVALRATKRLLNEIDGSLDEGVLQRAAELSAQVLSRPESQAILRARLGAG